MTTEKAPTVAIHEGGRPSALIEEAQQFIEEHRTLCLWFVRPDYRPETPEQLARMLTHIERYGDRAAYVKARQLKTWLLQLSSETSAD